MVSKIKFLAIVTVVALTTASGAFAQERGWIEQGGIKLPPSNGGGGGRPGLLPNTDLAIEFGDLDEPSSDFEDDRYQISPSALILSAQFSVVPSPPVPGNVGEDAREGGSAATVRYVTPSFGGHPDVIFNSLDFSGWNGKCWVWEGVCY